MSVGQKIKKFPKLKFSFSISASKAIPFLVPLCIENGLTLTQFNAIIALIKTMVEKVEVEHRSKLEQLSAIQKESRYESKDLFPVNFLFSNLSHFSALKYSMPTSSGIQDNSLTKESVDNTFSDLGLDKFLSDIEAASEIENNNSSVQYNSNSSNISSGDKGLSLQDKQR